MDAGGWHRCKALQVFSGSFLKARSRGSQVQPHTALEGTVGKSPELQRYKHRPMDTGHSPVDRPLGRLPWSTSPLLQVGGQAMCWAIGGGVSWVGGGRYWVEDEQPASWAGNTDRGDNHASRSHDGRQPHLHMLGPGRLQGRSVSMGRVGTAV